MLKRALREAGLTLKEGVRDTISSWLGNVWVSDHAGGGVAEGSLLKRYGIDLTAEPPPLYEGEASARLTTRQHPLRAEDVPLALSQSTDWRPTTQERGYSGVEFQSGLPTSEEPNRTTFRPVRVRGRAGGRGHGLYHETFMTASPYKRSWNNIVEGLTVGKYWVECPIDDPTEFEKKLIEKRTNELHDALMTMEGGWSSFIREWMYWAVAGFTVFEEVYHGLSSPHRGLIKKLAFRYPSSVESWILDEHGRNLSDVEFRRHNGETYILPARDLLLYSHDRFGNNFEGISPLRPIVRWVQMLQLFAQLEALSAERFGVPWVTAQRDGDAPGTGSRSDVSATLQQILRDAQAQESPVITLPDGTAFKMHSAAGVLPDFESAKRFALERITEVLKAEGALIGVGKVGAYAARDAAGDELTASIAYYQKHLCDVLNGPDNRPYTGTMKKMEDARYGGPIRPGAYCKLRSSVGDLEDPDRVARINESANAGTVVVSRDVQEAVHELLDLPALPAEEEDGDAQKVAAGPTAGVPGQKASDTALNGAQVTSMVNVLQQVAQGILPQETAVGILQTAFLLSEENATRLVKPSVGFAPSGGTEDVAASLDEVIRLRCALPDADEAGAELDAAEARLAKALRSVAVEHRDAYRDRVREEILSLSDESARASALEGLEEELRREFKPRYVGAAQESLAATAARASSQIVRDFGATVPTSTNVPVQGNATSVIRAMALDVGQEALNRQQGRFRSRIVEMLRGDASVHLPLLAESTYEQMGQRAVSTAYNAGRDSVVEQLKRQARRIGGDDKVVAERSSVLDGNTCEVCRNLDGTRTIVGSQRYRDLSPPNKCEGGGRCRCIWVYIMPDERGFEELVKRIPGASA